jgi:hypothetical protein
MAGIKITIPGVGGQIEEKKARIDAAVKFHWNLATASPEKKSPTAERWQSWQTAAGGAVGLMCRARSLYLGGQPATVVVVNASKECGGPSELVLVCLDCRLGRALGCSAQDDHRWL